MSQKVKLKAAAATSKSVEVAKVQFSKQPECAFEAAFKFAHKEAA